MGEGRVGVKLSPLSAKNAVPSREGYLNFQLALLVFFFADALSLSKSYVICTPTTQLPLPGGGGVGGGEHL
jgi:hypothetical protein